MNIKRIPYGMLPGRDPRGQGFFVHMTDQEFNTIIHCLGQATENTIAGSTDAYKAFYEAYMERMGNQQEQQTRDYAVEGE